VCTACDAKCSNGQHITTTICDGTRNSVTCKDCKTTCPSGQFLDGPTCDGMGIQDTTACLTKTCTCSHGVAATGTACPGNGHTNCISCVGEFYLGTGSTCLPWSAPCNPNTEVESMSPSNMRDRSCSPVPTCTCSHGVAQSGGCPQSNGNGGERCISCVGEFYLGTGSTCLPWSAPCNPTTEVESTSPSNVRDRSCSPVPTCTCSHGVAQSGGCPQSNGNGGERCISCVGEFYLGTGSTCLPWSAPCNPTTEVESTSPSNVRDRSCKPTTTTYEPCKNKLDGDGCQLCDPQDTDCLETSVVKQCQSGTCDAHHRCTCSHGVARTGSACPVGGEGERCVSCSGDFYLGTHSTCMPWSPPCHSTTEVESTSPSNTRDRVCEDVVAPGGGGGGDGGDGGDETSDDVSRCTAMEQSVCTPANKCIRTSSGGCIPYEDPSSESLE